MKQATRKWRIGCTATLLFILAAPAFVCPHGHARVFQGYSPQGCPAITWDARVRKDGYDLFPFAFAGRADPRIPGRLAVPAQSDGPWPLIIVLYGVGQDMKLFDLIAPTVTSNGFALVVFEQYGCGLRRGRWLRGAVEAVSLRTRARNTYVETRQLVDLLEKRPDIDSGRICLWGLSFGGMCTAHIAADEPRVRACVISVCGGDFRNAFSDGGAGGLLGVAGGLAGTLLNWRLGPLDPVGVIGKVAPRPVLFQNALYDEIIPRRAAEALHAAAGEPKQVQWYETNHSRKMNAHELVIFEDGAKWLLGQLAH